MGGRASSDDGVSATAVFATAAFAISRPYGCPDHHNDA
jgi:hypothetical protein